MIMIMLDFDDDDIGASNVLVQFQEGGHPTHRCVLQPTTGEINLFQKMSFSSTNMK